ncbi:MAG: flagellar motor switch protein FliG [Candidatus Omnitrophota bacterium]|jgi:flagellar motor switch protein FliG|nr:MAG: flagellar motor switch protein FliG [Candidatus Omnitrophota bacterium]
MPAVKKRGPLSGRKKAAILLLTLGPDVAADVYRNLSDYEIEQITLELANLGVVSQELSAQVIEEFYHTAMAKQYISHGGIATAREILERALGPSKALDIIERLQGILTGNPFDFLKHVDVGHLVHFVQHEHPQTIALILSHLEYDRAAEIMSALPPSIQHEVALRLATMDQISPEIIADVERVLEKKLTTVLTQEFTRSGGVDSLVELLNRVDQGTSRHILENLESENQELATEVKKHMFTFDDLIKLDDRAVQKILSEVDMKTLAAALKGAGDEVRSQIFSNMSSRAAATLQDDMSVMGPLRLKQVEESQQFIINVLRRMEENGEITISRGANEQYVD